MVCFPATGAPAGEFTCRRQKEPENFHQWSGKKCNITAASPKKKKNPATSVTVVTKMLEASAGSTLKARKVYGTKTPERAAAIMFSSMATPTINPNIALPFQK